MLVRRRRRLWRRFLHGGVVMETLLVTVICSPRRVSTSASAFALFHLHRPGCAWSSVSLRWQMLCRRSRLADALPQSSRWFKLLRADALPSWWFVQVDALPPFFRSCALVVVVSASRFSCRVLVRGVGRVLCLLRIVLLLFVLSLCFLVCVYIFSVFLYF